jgi:GNAT superfamily N-acetyltransferase
VEDIEDAMHANYIEALGRITALGEGGRAERAGGWLLLDAGGRGFDYFNLAVALPGASARVEDARDWFATRGIPFRFILRDTTDEDLVAEALDLGFRIEDSEPAMLLATLDSGGREPAGFSVRAVISPEDALAYATVEPASSGDLKVRELIALRGFALAGCSMLVGSLGGVDVARAMAVTSGAMTGVYNVFVRDEHRRSGLGSAITLAAIEAGRRKGATAACLSATPLGQSVYQRMGFVTRFRYLSLWNGA